MRAAIIFALMTVLLTRSARGIFNFEKPILLCKPPAPVCSLREQPTCSSVEEGKTGWICTPATLIQKAALYFQRKAADLVGTLTASLNGNRKTEEGNMKRKRRENERTGKGNMESKRERRKTRITKSTRIEKGNRDSRNFEKETIGIQNKCGRTEKSKVDTEVRKNDQTDYGTTGMRDHGQNENVKLRMKDSGKTEKGMREHRKIEEGKAMTKTEKEMTGMGDNDGRTEKSKMNIETRNNGKAEGGNTGMRHHGRTENGKIGMQDHGEKKKVKTMTKTKEGIIEIRDNGGRTETSKTDIERRDNGRNEEGKIRLRDHNQTDNGKTGIKGSGKTEIEMSGMIDNTEMGKGMIRNKDIGKQHEGKTRVEMADSRKPKTITGGANSLHWRPMFGSQLKPTNLQPSKLNITESAPGKKTTD